MIEETVDAGETGQPGYGIIGGGPEKIHADAEQDGIRDAGDKDPLPQPVFGNKLVRPGIRLEGYYNFFEQSLFSFVFLFD